MGKSIRTWQLISLTLAVALIAALAQLERVSTSSQPATGTLTTANSAANLEQLALSPNARRVHERYSL
ncbi:hypothetical protein H4C80_00470 [Pseudomonas juntendi]|uniref:Uncharacterized protein n=1 Tax=Pseudomonas juntendi TaxID=2666183 RepID=A0A7W2Q701_9PSED|nr:hypothetical protein [Pseudomonas juntendi]MBA6095623.1 hypothetical protein [Pseudomonas juntendi]